VKGAREHNLKGITLEIPKKKLGGVHRRLRQRGELARVRHPVREGQRRYVESTLRYAGSSSADGEAALRRSSGTVADHLHRAEGGVQQPRPPWAPSPRSTTTCGALRSGRQAALHHLRPARGKQSASRSPRSWPAAGGTKLTLLAPLIEQRRASTRKVLADARKRGFARARVDSVIRDLDEDIDLDKRGSTTLRWWSTAGGDRRRMGPAG